MTTSIKPKVFISYAHTDGKTEVKDFWSHLNNYLNSDTRKWDKWDDTQIAVGEEWDNIIQNALSSGCNCCLLLISDLFGKSSYITDKEWPVTLERFEEEGINFFPITFGVLESELEGLPEKLKNFQIYYPSVTDLYKLPPPGVTRPDETLLCYKDIDNMAVKDRFVSKLAIQMNTRFDEYIKSEEVKKKAQALASQANTKEPQIDLSLFVTNANDEVDLARIMFGSFSFEKRYRDSKSKGHYFPRPIDTKLDECLQNKDWILIEGHPLAGKTRAAFESTKRLINSRNSFALWSFSVPDSALQELILPAFPEADYQIVWMDDFDALLRDLSKRGYSASDINLFLKKIADNQLILIATARTGPTYDNLRNRFGLDDHLWDKLEPFLIDRLSGKEEKTFSKWYQETFSEELSARFDHNPGSLFLDLKAMRVRWKNIGASIKKSRSTVNAEHLRDLLKALHIFYIMEAYGAGGFFVEEDIRYYLLKKLEYQQNESSMGIAFSQVMKSMSQPFEGGRWEEIIELLSQDRFNLGFLRREGRYLVTETAYLDYIIAPDGERKIADSLNKALTKEDQEKLGISITNHNFADVFAKQSPKNEKQLMQLIRKLKPLGFEQDISVWNQLISLCHSQKLANVAIASLREKGLKPNQITYFILIQKTSSTDVLLNIIKEIKGDNIPIDDRFYVKLINSTRNFETAKMLITQIKDLGDIPNIHVYFELLKKSPDYPTAQAVLEEMKKEGLKPNSVTYERLLEKVPDYPTAQAVLEEMKKDGVKPNSVTYERLLQKVPDYPTAQAVLEEMKKDGVKPNSVTYERLLEKVPDYPTAQAVLEEMKKEGLKPNSVTYERLLQKVPDYPTAQAVLEEMKKDGVKPNSVTYERLLQKVPDYPTAQAVLEEMKKDGVKPNSVTYERLLQKVPDYPTAQAVLEEMKKDGVKPNSVTYDHVLQKVPDYPTAQAVLEEMKKDGVKPNSVTYERLLEKVPDYPTAQAVLEEMKKEGLKPNSVTYERLLQKVPDYPTAQAVLEEMKKDGVKPNSVTYERLLQKVPDYPTAQAVLEEMKKDGVKPNSVTYERLLQKVPDYPTAQAVLEEMKKDGVKPNSVTYDHVLQKVPDYPTAQAVLEEMKKDGVKPNFVTYERLLQKVPDYPTAQAVLEEMKKDGVKPNSVIYERLLEKVPDYPTAQAVLEEMKKEGLKPNSVTYERLLEKVPDYPTAQAVLEEMKKEGLKPNSVTYERLLEKVPDYPTAQAVLEEMKKEGLKPNSGTYDHVLQKVPDYPTAQTVLEEMKKEGLKPNSVTYERLLQKVPDYPTAQAVLEEMKKDGVKPNSVIYERLLEKVPDYPRAQTVLEEMKKEGLKPTITMYNIYFGKISSYQEVNHEINKLKNSGFYFPEDSTFYHLIRTADSYENSRNIFDEMLNENINPTIGYFNRLIQKSPNKEIAENLLKEIGEFSLKPNEATEKLLSEIGLAELVTTM